MADTRKDMLAKIRAMQNSAIAFAIHVLDCRTCGLAESFKDGEYCSTGNQLWYTLLKCERDVQDLEPKMRAMGIDTEELKPPGFQYKGREGN